MSIKLNIQLLCRYFQKNQCLNIKNMPHTAYKDQHMISMLIGPPGNCSACPCVNMALSLLIHSQYICISTYIWFNVMYVILFSLCVYARLNKLEERGNEIQRYMQLYTKLFSPLNSTGARCVRKNNKKYYIILQGGELTCFHFFKSSC